MMISITSAKCVGIDAVKVTVEVNVSQGIGIHLVGLADVAVKESLLRTMTALCSMGLRVPGKKIVINLAPADMHKKGSGYDVPIALGIIAASEQLNMSALGKYLILGELGLDGSVRPVRGALPVSEMVSKWNLCGCILPLESALETIGFCSGIVYGVKTLQDVLEIVCEKPGFKRFLVDSIAEELNIPQIGDESLEDNVMDFSEIVGQQQAKRALEIAAAGGHNVIMIGPPGSGKSSLAKALCRILPPMSRDEALQTSKIYSVAGLGNDRFCRPETMRPFRAPHNSASVAALIGGGGDSIRPGEISLSHNGVLFLDEFCEAPKHTMEALRAPMEDKKIVISRLRSKVEFPSDFMLVAATNPCPCGYYGEGDRCTCPVSRREAYLSRLSGPLMDRIDLQVWLHPIHTGELVRGARQESSAEVAARVIAAREIQKHRFASEGIFCNSQMNSRMLHKYCRLDTNCTDFLEKAADSMGLSARATTRIIKIARTIADMEAGAPGEDIPISVGHLAEAVSYRILDKKI